MLVVLIIACFTFPLGLLLLMLLFLLRSFHDASLVFDDTFFYNWCSHWRSCYIWMHKYEWMIEPFQDNWHFFFFYEIYIAQKWNVGKYRLWEKIQHVMHMSMGQNPRFRFTAPHHCILLHHPASLAASTRFILGGDTNSLTQSLSCFLSASFASRIHSSALRFLSACFCFWICFFSCALAARTMRTPSGIISHVWERDMRGFMKWKWRATPISPSVMAAHLSARSIMQPRNMSERLNVES